MKNNHLDTQDAKKERRAYVRVNIYAVTRYFCEERNAEIGVQTQIFDISEGGAKLLTFEEGIPMEAVVSMKFILPGEDGVLISVEGQVRHTSFLEKDLYRSGIKFLKVKEKDVLAIRCFVNKIKTTDPN